MKHVGRSINFSCEICPHPFRGVSATLLFGALGGYNRSRKPWEEDSTPGFFLKKNYGLRFQKYLAALKKVVHFKLVLHVQSLS